MKFGVVVFPGTWSDRDCGWVIDQVLGGELRYLWHKDADLKGCDCIILPGGFAYGDYLRTGAIARFAPVMEKVSEFADRGGLVWGICNGFQVLCEAGLLPGALLRNSSLEYRCQWTNLVVERTDLPFTSQCAEREVLSIPIGHGEGNYFADPATLSRLEQRGQVVLRYCDSGGRVTNNANPNGSTHNIAGIVNARGNVLGMMPHPERCSEAELGGMDGLKLFRSVAASAMQVLVS
ncbi:MAG TPA: phosphoribosylformylglycinamidine synthase subunit PurQ [Candidatus Dormibacteraeota bacterium]|nr:phosphoribosylformylglycinamidine synthase subunit PurQ [Candidatus Dormibacteraeota bacterium]